MDKVFEYAKEHSTGILLIVVLLLVFTMVLRKETMCGGCDQQCKCCGYETFARGSNERMMGGGGNIATLGDSYPERMMGRPIIYDDLLRQVGQGTV